METDRQAYRRKYYLDHREEIIARTTRYQKDNREKFRAYQKEWEADNKNRRSGERHLESCSDRRRRYLKNDPTMFIRKRLLSFARHRAKRFGIPFSLTIDDIYVPAICPVFGIPLSVEIGKRTDNSPSLDKVIPKLGYTKGNVYVVSWRANRLKGDATLKELEALVRYLKKNNTSSTTLNSL